MLYRLWNWIWGYKEVNCAGCGRKILCYNDGTNIDVVCSNTCLFICLNKTK